MLKGEESVDGSHHDVSSANTGGERATTFALVEERRSSNLLPPFHYPILILERRERSSLHDLLWRWKRTLYLALEVYMETAKTSPRDHEVHQGSMSSCDMVLKLSHNSRISISQASKTFSFTARDR